MSQVDFLTVLALPSQIILRSCRSYDYLLRMPRRSLSQIHQDEMEEMEIQEEDYELERAEGASKESEHIAHQRMENAAQREITYVKFIVDDVFEQNQEY